MAERQVEKQVTDRLDTHTVQAAPDGLAHSRKAGDRPIQSGRIEGCLGGRRKADRTQGDRLGRTQRVVEATPGRQAHYSWMKLSATACGPT